MSESGGWCVTIKEGDATRLFMVANSNRDEAVRMALSSAGGGTPFTCAELSEKEISDLSMEPNEIRESREVGRN